VHLLVNNTHCRYLIIVQLAFYLGLFIKFWQYIALVSLINYKWIKMRELNDIYEIDSQDEK